MSNKQPETVSELFPSRWLSHDDLNGRSYTLKIANVQLDHFHNPRTNTKELKAYLIFANAQKDMIVNVTQCHALTEIFKSERFFDWRGDVILSPGRAPNGKPTIIITAPAVQSPVADPHIPTYDQVMQEPIPDPDTLPDMAAANDALID